MKKIMILLVMTTMVATGAHAQINLGKLKDRVKNKIEKTVTQTAGDAVSTAKKKAKKTAKGIVGDNVSDAVGLTDGASTSSSDGAGTPSLTDKALFKKGQFRDAPTPAIDVKTLDVADKATFDANDGVSLDNISSSMSVGQLKVAATLYFRQQIRNLNEGNFDAVANEMVNPENTGVKIYKALEKKDGGEAYYVRQNMQTLNYFYTCSMFMGVPYNECSTSLNHQWNGVGGDKQEKLALYGNLNIPQYTKDKYYKLYDYYTTLAERESKSDACKKLYLYYATVYHDKPADPSLFSDENPEETDAEWKSLNTRLAALLKANGGGGLKTIAQLRTEKKEADAALLAQDKAEEIARFSKLPEGINDPKLEARALGYAKKYWNSNNGTKVVKVILHKGWGYKTNILDMRVGRSKGVTFVVRSSDGKYYRHDGSLNEITRDGKNYSPNGFSLLGTSHAYGSEINYKE